MIRWLVVMLVLGLAGCTRTPEKEAAPTPVPDVYRVLFDTSDGPFTIEVHKDWAPEGAERFYRLVERRYYDEARFFRVVRNFVVQFGINGDPKAAARWRNMTIKDDPVKESNKRGYVTFATSGPNTRTTQVFINLADNVRLDKMGFSPFGRVVEGMEVVDRLYSFYGEGPPRGTGPDQEEIERRGNEYLQEKFPRLDYVRTARIQR
jgi:peptidyl-prolyl cis-trans isomerase A (cyclophilin A)